MKLKPTQEAASTPAIVVGAKVRLKSDQTPNPNRLGNVVAITPQEVGKGRPPAPDLATIEFEHEANDPRDEQGKKKLTTIGTHQVDELELA